MGSPSGDSSLIWYTCRVSNTRKVKSKVTQVKPNASWGLYMWRLPNGKLFKDNDGNYLNIPAIRGDLEKIVILRQAAAYYGQPNGSPHFEPGVQRATEEEYREQNDRLAHGETLTNDIGLMVDEKKAIRERKEKGYE